MALVVVVLVNAALHSGVPDNVDTQQTYDSNLFVDATHDLCLVTVTIMHSADLMWLDFRVRADQAAKDGSIV